LDVEVLPREHLFSHLVVRPAHAAARERVEGRGGEHPIGPAEQQVTDDDRRGSAEGRTVPAEGSLHMHARERRVCGRAAAWTIAASSAPGPAAARQAR
jgi:hypothetical protein